METQKWVIYTLSGNGRGIDKYFWPSSESDFLSRQ